jgi:hypothetical protein
MPYWLSLCVSRRTCRQNRLYETLFPTVIILSKHHHHPQRSTGYSGNMVQAKDASFNGLSAIHIDITGRIFIADEFNNIVRMIDTAGVIKTVAGRYVNI